MTASLRNAEIRALHQIVEAAEGEPDAGNLAAAQSAAVILRGALDRFDRTPTRKAPKGTPTPPSAREAVLRRSGGRREAGSIRCRVVATQVHHRDRDRKNNDLSNLLHVCTPCHERIHAMPELSLQMGWMTRRNGNVSQPLYIRGES